MSQHLTVDTITSDALDELYFRLARAEEGERRAKARARHWYHRASRYSEAWMSARRGRRTLSAELTRRAPLLGESQAALARVHALCTDWLSTGAPPLGTSIARWWDKRLIELAAALDEPKEPTPLQRLQAAAKEANKGAALLAMRTLRDVHRECAAMETEWHGQHRADGDDVRAALGRIRTALSAAIDDTEAPGNTPKEPTK